MLPACLSLLYSLLFLLEPVSDALSIHHFFSADFFIFCAGCFIIMILFLCCIKFLIKCLYRVKIMFFHDRGKPLFHIGNLFVKTVNLLL